MKIINHPPLSAALRRRLEERKKYKETLRYELDQHKTDLYYVNRTRWRKHRTYDKYYKKKTFTDNSPKKVQLSETQKFYNKHKETPQRHNLRGYLKRQKIKAMKTIKELNKETRREIEDYEKEYYLAKEKQKLEDLERERENKEYFKQKYAKRKTEETRQKKTAKRKETSKKTRNSRSKERTSTETGGTNKDKKRD